MAIIIQEDGSSHASGTEFQNIAGWEVIAGTGNDDGLYIDSNGAIAGAVSTAGCLARVDTGQVDHWVEWTIPTTPSLSNSYYGGAICANAQNDCITVRHQASNNGSILVGAYEGTTSSFTALKTFMTDALLPGVSPTAGDRYKLGVIAGKIHFYKWNTGTLVFDLLSPSNVSVPTGWETRTHAGIRAGHTGTNLMDDVVVGNDIPAGGDSLTVDLNGDRAKQTFAVIGATRAHPFTGTYSGSPTAIRRRVVDFVTKAVVLDWATFDNNPTGGTFSGSVDFPIHNYIEVEFDFANDAGVTGKSIQLGFGITAEGNGQSNTGGLFSGTDAEIPNVNTIQYDAVTGQWITPTGAMIAALNAIQAQYNCCVAMVDSAVGATALTAHMIGGSNAANRAAALAAVGGKLNFLLLGIGETDSSAAGGFLTELATYRAELLAATSQTSATLPMFLVQLGREKDAGTGSDSGWNTIRQNQTQFADENTDVFISHQTMDLPMDPDPDVVHRSDAGSLMEVLRFNDSYLEYRGVEATSGRGPIVTSATYDGAVITVTLDLNGSTSMTVPANAHTLYEVSDDDFVSELTVLSMTSPTTNTLEITLDAPVTGDITLRSHQLREFNVPDFPLGTELYNGQAVMVEPITIGIAVTDAGIPLLSTINLTITGIPDGVYTVDFTNPTNGTLYERKSVTFSGDNGSTTLVLAVSTTVEYTVRTGTHIAGDDGVTT